MNNETCEKISSSFHIPYNYVSHCPTPPPHKTYYPLCYYIFTVNGDLIYLMQEGL